MLCATSSEQAGIAPQNRCAYCKTYTKDRKETAVHVRIGRSQPAFSPNIEEVLEDVKHARARQKAMNIRTRSRDGTPPRIGGVSNERGYQEDQPRDAASATCCALLRPLPEEPESSSESRRSTPDATNSHPSKR
jgi:hypothetical protein